MTTPALPGTDPPPLLAAPVVEHGLTAGPLLGAPIVEGQPQGAAPTQATTEPTTVAPTSPPAPPLIPQQPVLDDYTRQQLAELEQLKGQQRAQAAEGIIVQKAQAFQRKAQAMGLSPEDALALAQDHYTELKRVDQQQAEWDRLRAENDRGFRAKLKYAEDYGRKFNLSPTTFMNANSPNEMELIGMVAQTQAQLKAIQQGQVPAQTLNGGATRAGQPVANLDNIDMLYVNFDREHPNQSNPYEAQYRKLLGR